jgi:hypothetical protein
MAWPSKRFTVIPVSSLLSDIPNSAPWLKKQIRRLGGARDRQPSFAAMLNGMRATGWHTCGDGRTIDVSLEPAGAELSFCTTSAPPSTYLQTSPELTEVGRGRSVNLASVGPALQAAC